MLTEVMSYLWVHGWGSEEAMVQALVPYHGFAGEVVDNSVGESELLCNNRGVDFMEAYPDAKPQDLSLYNPNDSIEGKLVPKKQRGVLCVQVTLLSLSLTHHDIAVALLFCDKTNEGK